MFIAKFFGIGIRRVQERFTKLIMHLLISLKEWIIRTWQTHKINWKFGFLFLIIGSAVGLALSHIYAEVQEKASMGTLYLYSIPVGAKVYIAPEGTLMAENIGLGPKIGSPESHAGHTPESKKLEPFKKMLSQGFYDVGVKVTAEQIHEILGTSGNIDFEFDGDFVIAREYDPPGSGNIPNYTKIYKLWIVSGRDTSLIALFQPKNVSYSVLLNTSLFPPEEKFQFDDEKVKNDLLGENAKPLDIPYMLKLLHRGGKIVWKDGEYTYVMDLINKDRYISTYEDSGTTAFNRGQWR